MKGQPMTQTGQPARRRSRPLRGLVIGLIAVLLLFPDARAMLAEWTGVAAGYVIGFTLALLICLFVYGGGTRARRR